MSTPSSKRSASIDHPKLMKRALELDKDFDVSPYPHFAKIVEEDEVQDA